MGSIIFLLRIHQIKKNHTDTETELSLVTNDDSNDTRNDSQNSHRPELRTRRKRNKERTGAARASGSAGDRPQLAGNARRRQQEAALRTHRGGRRR